MAVRVGWIGLCLGLAASLPGYVWPQGPTQSEGTTGGFDDPLNLLQALEDPGESDSLDATVAWTAGFELERGAEAGRLFVRADLKPGWHLYSTTQPRGGPQPTVIRLAATDAVELTGPFKPDRDPRVHADPAFDGARVEEFYDDVTWTAPIRVAAGVDPRTAMVEVVIDGQLCATEGACLLVSDERVRAGFAGFYDPVEAAGRFEDQAGNIVILGHVRPRVVAPGGTLELVLTAQLAPSHHIYQLAAVDHNKISKPTLIVLRKTSGWSHGTPQPSAPPKAEPSGLREEPILHYHEGTVSWTIPIQVAADAQPGDYELAGSVAFQTCTATFCGFPSAVDFSVTVAVGATVESGVRPLAFTVGSYSKTAQDAAATHRDSDSLAAEPSAPPRTRFGDQPLAVILALAFLAGLILNVMPCVLPVIGLKIMSFVQQAGGSRREILSLNLWFSFGLMAVFWILAGVAVFAKLGWGEHFSDTRFLVTMIGVVFAFGLSFLGVWEIPIPGFVGGSTVQGVAQKEGAAGAFSKGVLSTVLATPCAGPFLVPAVSWAAAQPPALTYLTFTSIGLGMASPYLLIGAFPHLIRVLPKPGAWMVTFKQIMGFLLMGTVVFLFNALASEWVIPTLTLLLGIGIACWWIGRLSVSAELTQKLVGWSWAGIVIALAGYVGFVTLVSAHRLEWQPFSRATLDRYLEEGYTVLVDFTADWCPTCKTNEAVALNTDDVVDWVARNGVIPIKADKTRRRQDIDDLLVELGNPGRGIPFYAVYPSGGGEPITFDGLITSQQVVDALEQAGPSVTRPTTPRRENPSPPSQSASLGTGGR